MRNKRWPWIAAATLVVVALVAVLVISHRGPTHAPTSAPSPSTTSATSTTAMTTTSTATTVAPAPSPAVWDVTATPTRGTTGSTQWTSDRVSVTENGHRTATAGVIETALNAQIEASITNAASATDFPVVQYDATLVRFDVLGDRYLSVIVDESSDFGGAHGTTSPNATTFALDSGAVVDPLTLFRSAQAGLDAISAGVRPRVAAYFEGDNAATAPDWQSSGVAPVETNFHTLSLRPDGVLVTFDEYQVGAYSEGIISAVVPWAELDSALKPGAVPPAERRSSAYTVGIFGSRVNGWPSPPPPDIGRLDDVLQVNLRDQNVWALATIESTGEVVVMHSPLDARSNPTTWVVDARGPWPLQCTSGITPVLRTQGLPC